MATRKLAHFNRERIPERIVHAKDVVLSVLSPSRTILPVTPKRLFFSKVGKRPICSPALTVAGERGAADTERDVRGFALKFYTDEGNWDLVGNNTPVFFVRDPLKFPDFIHTQKRDPKTNLRSNTAMWDFWSLTPGIPSSGDDPDERPWYPLNMRQQHGFGSHTYSFYNAGDKRVWVKFHKILTTGNR